MRTLKAGNKEYRRVTVAEVVNFIRDEARRVGTAQLGDYEALTRFDLRDEIPFLLYLDNRPSGFACVKMSQQERRLTKLYVTPASRRHGCASHLIRGLRITQVTIPIGYIQFISLCRAIGFRYNAKQNYPTSIAELHRTPAEMTYARQHKLPTSSMG